LIVVPSRGWVVEEARILPIAVPAQLLPRLAAAILCLLSCAICVTIRVTIISAGAE
jgi:hypothetical protein